MKISFIRTAVFISLAAFAASVVFAQERTEFAPLEQLALSVNISSEDTSPDDSSRQSLVNFVLAATIKNIADGDSVTLEGAHKARFKIRLSDMDTPEIEHTEFTPRGCKCKTIPFRPGQPGGKAATEALKNLVSVGDAVVAECYEIDWYGRMVCHIFKGRTNINLEMIKNGWGWLPRDEQLNAISAWIRDPASYDAEAFAKQKALGAWGLSGQASPRQWRTDCWNEGKCAGAEQ
ncbi:thermonuclease family protein [Candidatus Spongiihabitans sp.]|uniref:thermonuclease family protein n=1 Tax=Candidatus Spongiihabitans sp. TaxID=3101308 RepID=UPI003C7D427D